MISLIALFIVVNALGSTLFAVGEVLFNFMFRLESKGYFAAFQRVKWGWFLELGSFNDDDFSFDSWALGDLILGFVLLVLLAATGYYAAALIILAVIVIATHWYTGRDL